MRVYIVFLSDDPFELPIGVYDTLTEVSNILNVSRETIRTGLKRHNVYKGIRYSVEKVFI